VEELKYRRSLKIALDILNQNVSPRQVPPSAEGPNTQLSQENNSGSLSPTPLRRCRSRSHFKEKLEAEASKKKRERKNNPSLKTDTKKQRRKGASILEESAKTPESGTNPPTRSTGDLHDALNSDNQNCKIPESKSLRRQKKIKLRSLTKSKPGNKVSLKPKEEKSKQRRKNPRGAGSPVSCRKDLPEDQAQPLAGEGSPLSPPCKSGAAVPDRRANARRQPRRASLDSACKSASDDLENSISSESESLAKQLGGRRRPGSLKRINGEQESATASSCRKRKCKNYSESSSGPSNHGTLSDSFPSEQKEEENKNASHVVMSNVKQFQLPDFEEDEGGHIAWGRENLIPFDCRALLLILECCMAFVNGVPKLLVLILF